MALTVALSGRNLAGVEHENWGTLAFDSSYDTGGEAFTAANMGLKRVLQVVILPSAGYTFVYDYTNAKVLAYYADYDAVADGALIQVAGTTDLSAVTGVRWRAWGYN